MRRIIANHNELARNRPFTFLTAEGASGAGTLTVENIVDFAINQIISIGEIGDELAEIIKTHASTAPSGNTITLASNLARTHAPYTKVRIILYDQIEFSHAATATGVKSVLTTKALDFSMNETTYDDTAQSSGYYFYRFKNTIGTTYSAYSDPIPYAGFEQNTVKFVIDYSLKRNKMKGFTEFVDYQFCLDEINACLQFITGKLKGWSKLLKLNYVLGQTSYGSFKFTLPTDIWENRGIKSFQSVRVGSDIELDIKNWTQFEEELEGAAFTQVRTAASAGATTLEIDNSYDFDDSGIINVYISGTLYAITYTGVTRSATAGVLTGIPASGTGAITVTIPVDTYIWQDEETGKPEFGSVDSDGNFAIWPLPSASYDNLNINADYYTGPTKVDSDADELDAFRYDAVKHWLVWAIRMQNKNDSKRDLKDGDYIQFLQVLSDYIRNEKPQRKKRGVKVNSISY